MQEGQRVRGMDVGVLAALGRSRVLVRPRPRVVTFSAGSTSPSPGRRWARRASGSRTRSRWRDDPRGGGRADPRAGSSPPDADVLKEKFQSYLPQADVFLTTGGLGAAAASVRAAADGLGDVDVWELSVPPGHHGSAIGTIQGRPLFALPENPVAAALAFELFVRPALLKMAGRRTLQRPEVMASIEDGFEQRAGRETYLRVRAWQRRLRLAGAARGPPGPERGLLDRRRERAGRPSGLTRAPSSRASRSG